MYLSAQRLSFCPYALYRDLIIAIDRVFSFVCSVLSNKHHFKLIDATLFNPEVGFYMNCFYLDCCLELGAIPVSAVLLVRCATTFCTCIKCSSLRARSYFNVFTLTC